MNSFWGDAEEEGPAGFTERVKTFVEGGGKASYSPPRSSRPPLNATTEERRLHAVFNYLRGQDNYVKKTAFASDVLNGEYGIRNEILARLMMGPNEFREVIEDRRDVVPPLLELLFHKDIDIRVKVAKALAERGDGRVLFDMYGHLEEPEYWARYEFSIALGKVAKRLTDVEAVSEIRTFMEDRSGRFDGIAPALMLVKMHLNRLKSPDDDKKSVPPTLREPPMAVPIAFRRYPDGRRDTSVQVDSERNGRPDTTMRIVAAKPMRPDTTLPIPLTNKK